MQKDRRCICGHGTFSVQLCTSIWVLLGPFWDRQKGSCTLLQSFCVGECYPYLLFGSRHGFYHFRCPFDIWQLFIFRFSFYFLEIKVGRIDPNRFVPNRCNSIESRLLGFGFWASSYHLVSAVRHDPFGVLRSFLPEQSYSG